MAGTLADMLLNLAGNEDPRKRLAALAAGGGTQATPQPVDSTQGGSGGGGGAVAPGTIRTGPNGNEQYVETRGMAGDDGSGYGWIPTTMKPPSPPQAQAYQSPNELLSLYSKLMERDRAAASVDRGIGLIGASLAQEENRPGIMAAFNGGGGRNGGADAGAGALIDQLMQVQKNTAALETKAAQRANLPSIAKQYGLDLKTAEYLFESGALDDVIKEASKEHNQVVQQPDGSYVIVDKNVGTVSAPFGATKPDEIEIQSDDKGNKFPVYKTGPKAGQRVGTDNLVTGSGANTNEQNLNVINEQRKAAGSPPLSMEDFLKQESNKGTGKATFHGVPLPDPPKDHVWQTDDQGTVLADPTDPSRPLAVPAGNGPADTRKKDDLAEKVKVRQAGIVVDAVDEAINQIDTDSMLPKTGIVGDAIKSVYQPSKNLAAKMDTIRANSSLDKLSEMRAASTSGASGLGSVTEGEHKLLQGVIASLDQAQDDKQLKAALRLFRKTYQDIIDGEYSPNKGNKPAEAPTAAPVIRKFNSKTGKLE